MKKMMMLFTAIVFTAGMAIAQDTKTCCKKGETCTKACTEACAKHGCKDGKCNDACKKACKEAGNTDCKKGKCCKAEKAEKA
jgi:hypothetical protein